MFGRHAHSLAMPLGRPQRHTPRACVGAAVALHWVRHGAFARTPRLELFGANPLRTIAPESLRMMAWSFWAADARSEWVAWLRRTAALVRHGREAASSAAWRVAALAKSSCSVCGRPAAAHS